MSRLHHGRHAQRDYLPASAWLVCIALGLYFAALCAIIHTLFIVFDVGLSVIGEALK